MRVLVSGATGHVGGAVVQALATSDHEIVGMGRNQVSTQTPDVQLILLDIGTNNCLQELTDSVEPCDAIVHCAASIDMSLDAPEISRTNCNGTHNLIEAALRWKARRFIFISSIAVLGSPDGEPFDEEHSLNPATPYAFSKVYGENLVRRVSEGEMSGVSLRLTSPVGPGLTQKRIFSLFVEKALSAAPLTIHGQGTRIQNYIDVRDVAKLVETCLSNPATGTYNVAGNEGCSNLQLAEQCISVLNSSSTIEFTGQPDADDGVEWEVPNDKARQTFGFSPQHGIDDSIRVLAGK